MRYFSYHYDPAKRTFQIVARIKDSPGSLGALLTGLRPQVNLVSTVGYTTADGRAVWSAFAEALGDQVTEETLRKAISDSKSAEDAFVEASQDGLLVDAFHRGIEVGQGEEFVLFPAKGLSHTFDELAEVFGGGGEEMLYDEGFSLGRVNGKYFAGLLGSQATRDAIARLALLYGAMGWGELGLSVQGEGSSFIAAVFDCFECSGMRRVRRSCSFMRGHLAGVLSTVFEVSLNSKETKCRLRNDDVCEFQLSQAPLVPV